MAGVAALGGHADDGVTDAGFIRRGRLCSGAEIFGGWHSRAGTPAPGSLALPTSQPTSTIQAIRVEIMRRAATGRSSMGHGTAQAATTRPKVPAVCPAEYR